MNLTLTDRIFGIECPHCYKRGRLNGGYGEGMRFSYGSYSRGYHTHGGGAVGGGPAFFCMNCSGITWCEPYEQWAATVPSWITTIPDSDKAKHFPYFKYNKFERA